MVDVDDWRTDRVGSALAGTNPTVMARLDGAFAVIGDVQFLPGYSVAITDRPGADRLTDLPRGERLRFLAGMEALGEAVERACSALDPAFRRVNLEILGNTDAFLHAHVWPRYEWEPSRGRSGSTPHRDGAIPRPPSGRSTTRSDRASPASSPPGSDARRAALPSRYPVGNTRYASTRGAA